MLRGFAWQFEPASQSPVRKCPPLDSDSCEVLLSCTDIFVHLSDAVGWGEPVPYDRSRIEEHSTANRGQQNRNHETSPVQRDAGARDAKNCRLDHENTRKQKEQSGYDEPDTGQQAAADIGGDLCSS